ncbi:MAG: hypothetical protein AAFU82_19190 [Pseudomonadota bacterium]
MKRPANQPRTRVIAAARSTSSTAFLWTALIVAALILTACGQRREQITFDGQAFRANLNRVDGLRDTFTIEVSPASASIEGAREAGRYESTVYCIDQYGTSDVEWVLGPDDPDEELQIENDRLILQGTCAP